MRCFIALVVLVAAASAVELSPREGLEGFDDIWGKFIEVLTKLKEIGK